MSDRPGARSEQSSGSLARPVLEINNGLPIQVRIPIEQREGKVVFPIKNCSGYALTFNSDVSVTCGCTRARLDPLEIGPIAVVSRSTSCFFPWQQFAKTKEEKVLAIAL